MGSLYVLSDVHGYRDDLHRGLASAGLVDDGGRWNGSDDDVLWVLGDLFDRGPDGIGAADLMRSLQVQAPEQVHVLMGNHEILALGRHRFPGSEFEDSWRVNGGKRRDQAGLTEDHLTWLASLPLVARAGDFLLLHSDTTAYLSWGDSIGEINETVRDALSDPEDLEAHWEVWARLTGRGDFAGADGRAVAAGLLDTLGGSYVVHGHSIISMMVDAPFEDVTEPLLYAGGLVLDIDGGRYAGGPLLVVRL
jgi:hypothetical protein